MVEDASERPVRAFISYAHDDAAHEEAVRQLWVLLRSNGIDARLDRPAADRPQDWPVWMHREVRAADFVLVVASPAYKRRAEGDAAPGEGAGVQWEARLIREEVYADPAAAVLRFLSVVLPGRTTADIPVWLGPATHTHYRVEDFTPAGVERLLRYLTGQPAEEVPPLGQVPHLPPRGAAARRRPTRGLRTRVDVHAAYDGADLVVRTEIAGTPLGERRGRLPDTVRRAWSALDLGAGPATERLATAGLDLGRALFDAPTTAVLSSLVDKLPPGNGVDVVLHAAGEALTLPVELVRLPGADERPLCLRAGVTMRRQVVGAPLASPVVLPGPLKVLAAVAAPDETRTENAPLDVEAEMQDALDGTTPVAVGSADSAAGQLRILEVAHPSQIQEAVAADGYHVLHLSAHGSATTIELEDEDGTPRPVGVGALIDALRRAGRPVPLILLSACSGAAGSGAEAMAAGLVASGADRVIAMQATVSDTYATALARSLLTELVAHSAQPLADALAAARQDVDERLSREARGSASPRRPEWAVATLVCASEDAPLVDPDAPPEPLTHAVAVHAAGGVRDLALGQLIGRRREVRTATAVLRRTPAALDEWGAVGGVLVTGIGGIGKTAVAGRVMGRLRGDGWAVAVHEGRWNPTALLVAAAEALRGLDGAAAEADALAEPVDDVVRLERLRQALARRRLLLVFDDFEQNLTAGGEAYLDPRLENVLAGLARAASSGTGGGLLITCRHPLPDGAHHVHDDLAQVPLPPLSASELRRLFLRLPQLRELDADGQRLLTRVIGGHPRLIEFVDALLRSGRSNLGHVRDKLREVARAERVDVRASTLEEAVPRAAYLGSRDVLFAELVDLLDRDELNVLRQIATCRCALTPDDVAVALTDDPSARAGSPLETTLGRLADLTLLVPGRDVGMHPWVADLVARHGDDRAAEAGRHGRAEAVHWGRFQAGRAGYGDLLDLPRHMAALGRYDELAELAGAVVAQMLTGTVARLAYLGDIRHLVPRSERAWVLVTDLEVQALLAVGDLAGASTSLREIHKSIERRAAADPHNTEWQRDLSISHERLGDVATAAGDLAAARTAYQASLDIAVRLAAADPHNTQWQRDLSISHDRLGDVVDRAPSTGHRDRQPDSSGEREWAPPAVGSPTSTKLRR